MISRELTNEEFEARVLSLNADPVLVRLLREAREDRAEIERLRAEVADWKRRFDMSGDEVVELTARAEAAEAKLAIVSEERLLAISAAQGLEARLAEEEAERMIAYAEYRRAEADLAAERAKTAKLCAEIEKWIQAGDEGGKVILELRAKTAKLVEAGDALAASIDQYWNTSYGNIVANRKRYPTVAAWQELRAAAKAGE